MNNPNQIGILHEIGDMGLGFDPLSETDQKVIEEQEKKGNTDKEA